MKKYVIVDGLGIKRGRDLRVRDECIEVAGEHDAFGCHPIVHGADPEPVGRQQRASLSDVNDNEHERTAHRARPQAAGTQVVVEHFREARTIVGDVFSGGAKQERRIAADAGPNRILLGMCHNGARQIYGRDGSVACCASCLHHRGRCRCGGAGGMPVDGSTDENHGGEAFRFRVAAAARGILVAVVYAMQMRLHRYTLLTVYDPVGRELRDCGLAQTAELLAVGCRFSLRVHRLARTPPIVLVTSGLLSC